MIVIIHSLKTSMTKRRKTKMFLMVLASDPFPPDQWCSCSLSSIFFSHFLSSCIHVFPFFIACFSYSRLVLWVILTCLRLWHENDTRCKIIILAYNTVLVVKIYAIIHCTITTTTKNNDWEWFIGSHGEWNYIPYYISRMGYWVRYHGIYGISGRGPFFHVTLIQNHHITTSQYHITVISQYKNHHITIENHDNTAKNHHITAKNHHITRLHHHISSQHKSIISKRTFLMRSFHKSSWTGFHEQQSNRWDKWSQTKSWSSSSFKTIQKTSI
jgi:hypothetical protein